MLNKRIDQFVKDLSKVINDNRVLITCTKLETQEKGFYIHFHFQYGHKIEWLGKATCFLGEFESVTGTTKQLDIYDYFFDCLQTLKSLHPTNKDLKTLIRIKVDMKAGKRVIKYKVTNQSDYEFLNCGTYTKLNADMINTFGFENGFSEENIVKVFDADYTSYVSNSEYSYTQDLII